MELSDNLQLWNCQGNLQFEAKFYRWVISTVFKWLTPLSIPNEESTKCASHWRYVTNKMPAVRNSFFKWERLAQRQTFPGKWDEESWPVTGEYPEDFQHCSQDRHGKDHCCNGSIVWPRDTGCSDARRAECSMLHDFWTNSGSGHGHRLDTDGLPIFRKRKQSSGLAWSVWFCFEGKCVPTLNLHLRREWAAEKKA